MDVDSERNAFDPDQGPSESPHVPQDASDTKQKKARKPQPVVTREPGKSLFPVSRVQKIIKADKDIPIVAKEATFLISLATEEFIKRLCESAQKVAERSNRMTIQHKDVATIVRKADEFLFLEDTIPWSIADASGPKKKPRPNAQKGSESSGPTMLDRFVGKKPALSDEKESKDDDDADEDGVEEDDGDVVMMEDGTMTAT
ncbi:histone-fold-containing protein [Hymenopellis radicata]|nr:histone-fold-containing protein [Hymenopellis radicata]